VVAVELDLLSLGIAAAEGVDSLTLQP